MVRDGRGEPAEIAAAVGVSEADVLEALAVMLAAGVLRSTRDHVTRVLRYAILPHIGDEASVRTVMRRAGISATAQIPRMADR